MAGSSAGATSARSTDERTMISSLMPRTAVPDGTLLLFPTQGSAALLEANLSSFMFDYRDSPEE